MIYKDFFEKDILILLNNNLRIAKEAILFYNKVFEYIDNNKDELECSLSNLELLYYCILIISANYNRDLFKQYEPIENDNPYSELKYILDEFHYNELSNNEELVFKKALNYDNQNKNLHYISSNDYLLKTLETVYVYNDYSYLTRFFKNKSINKETSIFDDSLFLLSTDEKKVRIKNIVNAVMTKNSINYKELSRIVECYNYYSLFPESFDEKLFINKICEIVEDNSVINDLFDQNQNLVKNKCNEFIIKLRDNYKKNTIDKLLSNIDIFFNNDDYKNLEITLTQMKVTINSENDKYIDEVINKLQFNKWYLNDLDRTINSYKWRCILKLCSFYISSDKMYLSVKEYLNTFKLKNNDLTVVDRINILLNNYFIK